MELPHREEREGSFCQKWSLSCVSISRICLSQPCFWLVILPHDLFFIIHAFHDKTRCCDHHVSIYWRTLMCTQTTLLKILVWPWITKDRKLIYSCHLSKTLRFCPTNTNHSYAWMWVDKACSSPQMDRLVWYWNQLKSTRLKQRCSLQLASFSSCCLKASSYFWLDVGEDTVYIH